MKVSAFETVTVDRTAMWGYAAFKISESIRESRNLFPGDYPPWIERRVIKELEEFLTEACISIAYPNGMDSPAHQLAKEAARYMFDCCLVKHEDGIDAAIQAVVVTFHLFDAKVMDRDFAFNNNERKDLKYLYYFLRGVAIRQASMLEFKRGRFFLEKEALINSYFLEH